MSAIQSPATKFTESEAKAEVSEHEEFSKTREALETSDSEEPMKPKDQATTSAYEGFRV